MSEMQNKLTEQFPDTPEFIAEMVRNRVHECQKEKTVAICGRKLIRVAVFAFACVLSMGGTVYAVSRLWNMHVEKQGKYAIKAEIEGEDVTNNDINDKLYAFESTYLPDNLEWDEVGISSVFYLKDMNKEEYVASLYFTKVNSHTEWLDKSVESYDTKTINNHQMIHAKTADGRNLYYVLFEEEQMLLSICNFDIPDRDMEIIIENVSIEETVDENIENLVICNTWALGGNEADSMGVGDIEYKEYDFTTYSCSKEEMKNLHLIGERFMVTGILDARVTNVLISEDKISDAKIQYIEGGNGIDSLDEVVYEENIPMKLVTFEVEYINSSDFTLQEIETPCRVLIAKDIEEGYRLKSWEKEALSYSNIRAEGISLEYEVPYDFYFYNEETGEKLYAGMEKELTPGESQKVHWVYAIAEEDLPCMYLDLKNYFDNPSIKGLNPKALEIGLVDVRQK